MPKTDSLVTKLIKDYPQFTFRKENHDRWSPSDKTVYYNPDQPNYEEYLLHELSHAILNHTIYHKDIELIAIERDAWQFAVDNLAIQYNLNINQSVIDVALDSYRDWIHSKSACPRCDQTGIQLTSASYQCLSCKNEWRVNTGIGAAVRRYTKT